MALPFIQQLLPARTKPQVVPDGTVPQVGARSGRYMEQIVQKRESAEPKEKSF